MRSRRIPARLLVPQPSQGVLPESARFATGDKHYSRGTKVFSVKLMSARFEAQWDCELRLFKFGGTCRVLRGKLSAFLSLQLPVRLLPLCSCCSFRSGKVWGMLLNL